MKEHIFVIKPAREARRPEGVLGLLGKPLGTISAVQIDFYLIAFQPPPPPPSSNWTLWGYFFRRKLVNFLKQRF